MTGKLEAGIEKMRRDGVYKFERTDAQHLVLRKGGVQQVASR